MPQFVTISTFTLPAELAVAKSKLESLGIPCQTQDELTVQSYNFISNAVGGVKLQVERQNVNEAIEILRKDGFLKDEAGDLSSLEKRMNSPVFQKRVKIFSTLFFSLIGLILLIWLISTISNRPTDEERLVQGKWCLDYIEYAQQTYYPNTVTGQKFQFRPLNGCLEYLVFESNGKLTIPGFDSRALNGYWTLLDDRLDIFGVDALWFAFEGTYTYSLSNNQLVMESDSTRIFFYKSRY